MAAPLLNEAGEFQGFIGVDDIMRAFLSGAQQPPKNYLAFRLVPPSRWRSVRASGWDGS
jgi:CBS domain-containing protein